MPQTGISQGGGGANRARGVILTGTRHAPHTEPGVRESAIPPKTSRQPGRRCRCIRMVQSARSTPFRVAGGPASLRTGPLGAPRGGAGMGWRGTRAAVHRRGLRTDRGQRRAQTGGREPPDTTGKRHRRPEQGQTQPEGAAGTGPRSGRSRRDRGTPQTTGKKTATTQFNLKPDPHPKPNPNRGPSADGRPFDPLSE